MDKRKLVLGSLVGDGFILGAHWIYDTNRIKAKFGLYLSPQEPLEDTWHKGKHKGDFTHYGDFTKFLDDYLKENEFDYDKYKKAFVEYMKGYKGYIDGATKKSLQLFNQGSKYGIDSNDLSGSAKIAPILAKYDRKDGVKYALESAKLLHNNEKVLATTKLWANLVYDLLEGKAIKEALEKNIEEIDNEFLKLSYKKAKGQVTSSSAIEELGQACSIDGGLASTLWLLLKYDNYKDAMVANVMGGGDSSARALIIGMVFAIISSIPKEWVNEINL